MRPGPSMTRAWGLACFLAGVSACGGSVETQPAGGVDAGSDGGSEPDGGTANDAGTPLPSDPGYVQCGGQPCESATSYCCDDNAANTEKCVPQTVSACGGYRRSCDESADCPAGTVCCLIAPQMPWIEYTTWCGSSCGADSFLQVCKSDAECTGVPCVTQPCHGETISTCGALPSAPCQ